MSSILVSCWALRPNSCNESWHPFIASTVNSKWFVTSSPGSHWLNCIRVFNCIFFTFCPLMLLQVGSCSSDKNWESADELQCCNVNTKLTQTLLFFVSTSVVANFFSGSLQIAHSWQETQHVTLEQSRYVQQIQSGPVSPEIRILLGNSTLHAWL